MCFQTQYRHYSIQLHDQSLPQDYTRVQATFSRPFRSITGPRALVHMAALIVFVTLQTCGQRETNSTPPDHSGYDQLLKRHVSVKGDVDYRALSHDAPMLALYLESLSKSPPDPSTWPREEQMAYWINAYNAFTLQLIVDHYPVNSILEISGETSLPFFNSPWDQRFIRIGALRMDLNNIEHGILRKKFDDPRIHMALVCASTSCPPLRNEAYRAETLNAQLDNQARRFVNDPGRNRIENDHLAISMIFNWYKGDFNRNHSSVIGFIKKHSEIPVKEDASIEYLPYDWQLNEKQYDP
jgi:hypothetical protein